MRSNEILGLAAAAALVSFFGSATAAGNEPPRYASREEARACMDAAGRLKAELAALNGRAKQHEATLGAHQEEAGQFMRQRPPDAADQEAVLAFNLRIESFNAETAELNARAAQLNDEMNAHNQRVATMNRRCATLVVRKVDLDALDRERTAKKAAAAKQP